MSQIQSWMDSDGNAHWPDSNVGEIKDYQIDWEARIAAEGDTMATVAWTIPTGLTKTSEDLDLTNKLTTVWLEAVTVGSYEVSCTITTTDNGEDQTYIRIMRLEVV